MFVTKNGVFLEKKFLAKEVSGRTVQLDEISESSATVDRAKEPEVIPQIIPTTEPEVDASNAETSDKYVTELHRSGRAIEPPKWFHNKIFILEDDEPVHYKEAMAGPISREWHKAMKSKMESMYENQVWNLVEPPEGVKPIGCKWIFKRKIDVDGKIIIHKARLVAKGFGQIQGVDYDETFSPVADESYFCAHQT